MKRFLVALLVFPPLAAASVGVAATAAPTFRLTVVHHFRGCHVWSGTELRGPTTTIRVKRRTRVDIRVTDPMDFEFRQLAGPKLALGIPRTPTGTVRRIVFRRPGRYVLRAKNIQTSDELGLETLGPDNVLRLTVVVR